LAKKPSPHLVVDNDQRPELRVTASDPSATASALVPILAQTLKLFQRGDRLVHIVAADNGKPPAICPASPATIIDLAHQYARPTRRTKDGVEACQLPKLIAEIVLTRFAAFPPLRGITMNPLLAADCSIRLIDGYDPSSGLFGFNPLAITVPDQPTRDDAVQALKRMRQCFRTFPFADATTIFDAELKVNVVDLTQPPGQDESAFLIALASAIAAPSLPTVPAAIIKAPQGSGSGTGKGMLMSSVSHVAFGVAIPSIAATRVAEELEKKITAQLLRGRPMLFLQNYNNKTLRSDLLASVITDRPYSVRRFGTSDDVDIDATLFIGITGNAISIGEDMTRRVILGELDARLDNPERRQFTPGFVAGIARARASIVSDMLCIWRWGRLNPASASGQPCGSFEQWAQWIRDPFVALGCKDPIVRQEELKKRDPDRQKIAEVFSLWWGKHQNNAMVADDIDNEIKELIDPPSKDKKEPSRQRIANYLCSLEGTQLDGYRFVVIRTESKWGVNKYQLTRPDGTTPESATATQPESTKAAAPQLPLAEQRCAHCGMHGHLQLYNIGGRERRLHPECAAARDAFIRGSDSNQPAKAVEREPGDDDQQAEDPREPGDDREFIEPDGVDQDERASSPSPPAPICTHCNKPIAPDEQEQTRCWLASHRFDLHKNCVSAWTKKYHG
jgi:hypothetical protein